MSAPPGKENATGQGGALKKTYDKVNVAPTAPQSNLFPEPSAAEKWCQAHGVAYRTGSFPGEIVITCLSCKRGRMFIYQKWALCLACGHVSESLQDLEHLLESSRQRGNGGQS